MLSRKIQSGETEEAQSLEEEGERPALVLKKPVFCELLLRFLYLLRQVLDILAEFIDALTVIRLAMEAHLYEVDPFGLQLLHLK